MSFRDNLQHLRATRNMTQEQLAMLLGVSRQSVTKWEAEKSYPEMDKLIKICQLFGCTLDDLVTGDLTQTPIEAPAIPAGPPADTCGYDGHWRRFSGRIATGAALCVLSTVPPVLLDGHLGVSLGVLSISTSSALGACLLFALIAAGCALIIPAGLAHAAFTREHPFVEDFYTTEDRQAARKLLSVCVTLGVVLSLAGLGLLVLFAQTWGDGPTSATFMTLVTIATWLFVWGGMMYGRVDVEGYNRNVGEELTDAEIDALPLEEAERAQLRLARDRSRKTGRVCGVIMIVATIVGLTWLFLGRALAPDVVEAGGVSLPNLFWLSWVVGGLGCGVASTIIKGH